jgi:hypothetical protein
MSKQTKLSTMLSVVFMILILQADDHQANVSADFQFF